MLSGGSGSLEDKVKFKERVQWARRAAFERGGMVIEIEWENGSTTFSFAFLKIPLDQQSRNQFYFQRLFLKNSVWANSKVLIPQFQNPLLFSQNLPLMPPSNYRPNSHLSLSAMVDCWAHLGINTYALTLTHISTFPRRSGTLVPVTYDARESMWQLWILQEEICGNGRVLQAAVRGGWETWQWWRLKLWEKERREDAWGIERL